MKEQREDRRVQRTKALLQEALLDLIIQKGYEAVTVQDLIDRANIGRSTFYFHYPDKDALLADTMDKGRDFLMEQMKAVPAGGETASGRFRFSLVMLQHVQSHKLLYRATVGKESGAAVMRRMQAMMEELAREELRERLSAEGEPPIPSELAMAFVIQTLMTLMAWWMDRHPQTPAKEVDALFHRLVLEGLGLPD